MKKIGKVGKINIQANKRLRKIFEEKGITSCEVRYPGCLGNQFLQFAHKHKRVWYRDKPELLSDFNEVVLACQSCHAIIERSRLLTEKVFSRCRK